MKEKSEVFAAQSPPYSLGAEPKDWQFSELKDRPEVVLSLLEPDQLVAAKERTRFGLRRLSLGIRVQLWALRIYVIVMMIIVAVSVYHAIQGAN